MKKETLFEELEVVLQQLEIRVVKDKGAFRSNTCMLENERVVVINKLYPVESRLATLAQILYQRQEELPFIKPSVRKELELLWKNSKETYL